MFRRTSTERALLRTARLNQSVFELPWLSECVSMCLYAHIHAHAHTQNGCLYFATFLWVISVPNLRRLWQFVSDGTLNRIWRKVEVLKSWISFSQLWTLDFLFFLLLNPQLTIFNYRSQSVFCFLIYWTCPNWISMSSRYQSPLCFETNQIHC